MDFENFSKMDFEQKKKFQQEVFNELVKNVDDFSLSTSNYKGALIDYGKFDGYSLYNRVLLKSQLQQNSKHLEAPVFKTYNDWKKEGVFIKKGAKAYAIIVPSHVLKYKDGDIWKNVTKDNKSSIEEAGFQTKKFTYFNLKNAVFHISDTNSSLNIIDKGANNRFTIDSDNDEQFQELYDAVKSSLAMKYNIYENDKLDVNVGGYASKSLDGERSIVINANSTASMKLRTLFHETAHFELDHLDSRVNIPTDIKELEAESTAFLFASKFGVDTDISELYLKSYSSNNDISKLFPRVFEATNAIESEFGSLIIDNINERDVNQNQVNDINEDDLFVNSNIIEMI